LKKKSTSLVSEQPQEWETGKIQINAAALHTYQPHYKSDVQERRKLSMQFCPNQENFSMKTPIKC
jgi:hypothetical protein